MNAPMSPTLAAVPLSDTATGAPMIVAALIDAGVPEWAQRLRELGFIEGETVRVVRRGQPGGEPLAVRVGVSTFALRRAEAACVLVMPAAGDSM
jgi:ferrous iron transport protein A